MLWLLSRNSHGISHVSLRNLNWLVYDKEYHYVMVYVKEYVMVSMVSVMEHVMMSVKEFVMVSVKEYVMIPFKEN